MARTNREVGLRGALLVDGVSSMRQDCIPGERYIGQVDDCARLYRH